MTIEDVVGWSILAAIVGGIIADRLDEWRDGKMRHEIQNLHTRLNGIEAKIGKPCD